MAGLLSPGECTEYLHLDTGRAVSFFVIWLGGAKVIIFSLPVMLTTLALSRIQLILDLLQAWSRISASWNRWRPSSSPWAPWRCRASRWCWGLTKRWFLPPVLPPGRNGGHQRHQVREWGEGSARKVPSHLICFLGRNLISLQDQEVVPILLF